MGHQNPLRAADAGGNQRAHYAAIVGALAAYYVGTLVVWLGAVFGFAELLPASRAQIEHDDPVVAFSRWDGLWYTRIATEGYSYLPEKRSSVAFFPLYPLLGVAISAVTGLRMEIALLIVAHAFLIACFVLLHTYVARSQDVGHRTKGEVDEHRARLAAHTLLAFAFWPTTFFFRMAYTESVFVFLCLLALYGMRCGWPLLAIALICGLATAARPVGIALLPAFGWHVWNSSLRGWRHWRAAVGAIVLGVVACWGLLAYMLYQQISFGDALAFAKTQESWRMREGLPEDKIVALVTFEPLWSVYVPSSDAYWANKVKSIEAPFNLQAANPVYFLIAVGVVAYGAWRRWLNGYEVLLAAGLILIPYETRSYEMCMASQGRFMAAVFPMYIVMGHLLSRIPSPWYALVLAPLAALMAIYAALFAAGFVVI